MRSHNLGFSLTMPNSGNRLCRGYTYPTSRSTRERGCWTPLAIKKRGKHRRRKVEYPSKSERKNSRAGLPFVWLRHMRPHAERCKLAFKMERMAKTHTVVIKHECLRDFSDGICPRNRVFYRGSHPSDNRSRERVYQVRCQNPVAPHSHIRYISHVRRLILPPIPTEESRVQTVLCTERAFESAHAETPI